MKREYDYKNDVRDRELQADGNGFMGDPEFFDTSPENSLQSGHWDAMHRGDEDAMNAYESRFES